MTDKNIHTNDPISFLASDEKFQDWVWRGEHAAYWETWFEQHSEYRPYKDQAKLLVLAFKPLSTTQITQIPVGAFSNRKTKPFWAQPAVWRYAASISLLLLFAWGLFQWSEPATMIYATGYGEQKTFVLADQTQITLQANSSLEVFTHWDESSSRSVRLIGGEAFFEVTKKPLATRPKFEVHANELTVEVLGTSFAVRSRRQRTDIALIEGKVNVLVSDRLKATLKPGNTCSYLPNGKFEKADQGAEDDTAWLSRKLHLHMTPTAEVAQTMEDLYGVSVVFADAYQGKKLSGNLPLDDLDVLLSAIAISLDAQVHHDNQIIHIK
ncbi:FecR domain-containing protein [Reichenbachiella carrageenanivorans]|uniref:FecR domain-containing protein n=1 Tax=Reichenbachiella carrageenanivorans TaxID=2979869 RepID=A0ABY6D125_9BACT|nr:FecR domain-containing protein [Reichenbachiella carrageenanivorans]UXX79876.1 FecR domain-containing protein [Reichenbachiella carrageenanivorans]